MKNKYFFVILKTMTADFATYTTGTSGTIGSFQTQGNVVYLVEFQRNRILRVLPYLILRNIKRFLSHQQ